MDHRKLKMSCPSNRTCDVIIRVRQTNYGPKISESFIPRYVCVWAHEFLLESARLVEFSQTPATESVLLAKSHLLMFELSHDGFGACLFVVSNPNNTWPLLAVSFPAKSSRLWGRYECSIEAALEKAYKPLPLPERPQYGTQDVSIVVATIETPDTLPESLCQWLENHPYEIIIVTIRRDLKLVKFLVSQVPSAAEVTQIVTCDVTNKREQLAMGIRMARGQVIALVDDDAFWPATTVLPYLLAGLEDPKVGGVQGKQRYVT